MLRHYIMDNAVAFRCEVCHKNRGVGDHAACSKVKKQWSIKRDAETIKRMLRDIAGEFSNA